MYTAVAEEVIQRQGGFTAQNRTPLEQCLGGLPVGSNRVEKLEVIPDGETGARCVHTQLVEVSLAGACRALHGEANLAVPPTICFECARSRTKISGIKRKVEQLRQRFEDEKGNVDTQLTAFIAVLKSSKKLTRCPYCETPVVHTNACDHMQAHWQRGWTAARPESKPLKM